MSNATATAELPVSRPFWPLGLIADLGGMAILLVSALAAPLRGRRETTPLVRVALAQAGWMLAMGIPLVGLIHMSLGSFLAMQAYFGATFTEAAGIVVGLGLIRNIAPLMTGFVLAGLIGVKVTAELRGGTRPGLDDDRSVPDRDVERGISSDLRPSPSPGRVALGRLLGAAVAGPVLSLWGVAIGCLMGLVAARSMLGQSTETFLGKIVERLDPIDVLGLVAKGGLFAGASALIAAYEGLRPESRGGPDAYRAVVRSVFVILFLNFTWFNLVYLGSNPFGPDVVAAH